MAVTLLDRYLLRGILWPTLASLAFLFQLILALQMLRRVDVLFSESTSWRELVLLVLNLTPHYLVLVLPVALLLGILVGLGQLSEDREIEALLACGISPLRLSYAPAVLALAVALAVFALVSGPEAAGLRAVHTQVDRLLKLQVQRDVKPGIFYDEVTGLTLFAQSIDPVSGEWHNVLVNDERDPRSPLLLLAKSGWVDPGDREALRLKLFEGQAHREEVAAADYFALRFDSCVLTVGVEDSLLRRNSLRSPDDELSLGALAREVQRRHRSGEEWFTSATAFHRRLGLALSVLAFAWMGTPLALIPASPQAARARSYLAAVLAVTAYFVLLRLASAWSIEGRLPPWLGGQLANLIFFAVGGVGWWRLRWRH